MPGVRLRVKEGYLHPIKKRVGKKTILLFNPDELQAELVRVQTKNAQRGAGQIARGRFSSPPKPSQPKPVPSSKAPSADSPSRVSPKPIAPPPPPLLPTPELKSAEESEGERCARAVKLFRDGKQQLDAVVEMGLTFERARYYWECYLVAQPGWFLSSKVMARVRALIGWDEETPTPEGFERALVAHTAKVLAAKEPEEGDSGPGVELSEEDREGLAELEREMSGKPEGKPEKKGSPTPPAEAAPVAVPRTPSPAPPAQSAAPLPAEAPSALAALASLTNLPKLTTLAEVK